MTSSAPTIEPIESEHSSSLGFATGVSTFVYLAAAVLLGTLASGLLGSGTWSVFVVVMVTVVVGSLLSTIVLDVLLGRRGGVNLSNAVIVGLFLLLPPTAVAFYLASWTLLP